PFSTSYRGLGNYYRTGYAESDLVDYRTKNLKASAAFHFRLKPSEGAQSPELIVQTNVGNGTTVYQGDNRFRLQDIFFMQNRIEIRKKDDFFIRIYATHENAGKSYDPYFTAQKLRDEARSQEQWASVYNKYWKERIIPRMNALAYPELVLNPIWWDSIGPVEDPLFQQYYLPYDTIAQQSWLNTYQDSLVAWHHAVEQWTNTGNAGIPGIDSTGYFAPGTPQFQQAFDRIIAAKNNEGEGGTRFYDRSALYNLQAEKRWRASGLSDLRIGMSARLYAPLSDGTIFIDTLRTEISDGDTLQVRNRIYNWQVGAYVGAERKLLEDKLTLSATIRADRKQDFAAVLSPAFSAIWNPAKQHYLRLSISSALRNPALTDQYLNLNVGPAILRGNLEGADSLITVQSFQTWRDSQDPDDLRYFNVNPIRPEQARTFELGYRGSFSEKWFLDAGVYTTYYRDFIGYKIGLTTEFDALGLANLSSIRVYRYAANSDHVVVTQGANVGLNYYYQEGHSIGLNYSFNRLYKTDEEDPIIPAFNTPKHKGNLSLSGSMLPVRDTKNRWGYGLNLKWVDAYFWEGSPQFTGPVPAFFLMDAQLNLLVHAWNTTFKAGCSNFMNNMHIEAYGGPYIGRLAYFSISYEWLKK
ncbi:MAG: TonB-dependent receptor plug domain-containing protein, partial [Flavobacteriales bacterium]